MIHLSLNKALRELHPRIWLPATGIWVSTSTWVWYTTTATTKTNRSHWKVWREDSFTTTIRLPKHSLTIDEPRFLRLLAGSASLMKDEKRRIIEAVPRLTQEQIDELIRILEEEKQKFSELDVEHKGQLEALESKQKQEWEELEMEMNAGERQEQEDSAADAIRQQLSGKRKRTNHNKKTWAF